MTTTLVVRYHEGIEPPVPKITRDMQNIGNNDDPDQQARNQAALAAQARARQAADGIAAAHAALREAGIEGMSCVAMMCSHS